jgi:hypothetical protein
MHTRLSLRVQMSIVVAFLLLCFTSKADANPHWNWEDRFSSEERQNLTNWIRHAHSGLESLFGHLPYSYDVHFHRTGGNKPVPWAHTSKRRNRRSVSFYVDTRFSNNEFERDWVAYHEPSHLMFPSLGNEGKWFAEGIASYLQYQAMYAAGARTWEQAIARFENRFGAAQNYPRLDDFAVVDLADAGRQSGWNIRLYWGGAAYFLQVDHRLHAEHGIRLNDVIRAYLDCCFGKRGRGAEGMIEAFDRISESRIFSEVYAGTVKQKGFPDTKKALGWLEANPPLTSEAEGP